MLGWLSVREQRAEGVKNKERSWAGWTKRSAAEGWADWFREIAPEHSLPQSIHCPADFRIATISLHSQVNAQGKLREIHEIRQS